MDNDIIELNEMLELIEQGEKEVQFNTNLVAEEQMPIRLHDVVDPKSLERSYSIRKKYIQQGGLGSAQPINGYRSPHDICRWQCVHCKKVFEWSPELECSDYGDVVDNLCRDCRKELRSMRTNHPEML